MKQIAGIVKTQTQNRKEIYKMLKMDKVPDGTNVLLAFLGHPRFIKMFKEDHPSSKITVLENKDLSWLFFNSPYDIKLVDPVNINLIKETLKDMKFDYIIMNPPYNGNLHLKILQEVIKHGKKTISLEPCEWLTNKLDFMITNKDQRYARDILSNKISYFKEITKDDFNKLFDTGSRFGVGIFLFDESYNKPYNFPKLTQNEIAIGKVLQKVESLPSLRSQFTNDKLNENYVAIRRTSHGYLPWYTDNKESTAEGIIFRNKKEIKNFKISLEAWLYKLLDNYDWLGKENSAHMPYMGNEINPRTGLKGYESEWTDEDFYKFFDLTADEIKIIEDTMKKYEV